MFHVFEKTSIYLLGVRRECQRITAGDLQTSPAAQKVAAQIQTFRKARAYASIDAVSAALRIIGVVFGTCAIAAASPEDNIAIRLPNSDFGNPSGKTAAAIFGARLLAMARLKSALFTASPTDAPKLLVAMTTPVATEIMPFGVLICAATVRFVSRHPSPIPPMTGYPQRTVADVLVLTDAIRELNIAKQMKPKMSVSQNRLVRVV